MRITLLQTTVMMSRALIEPRTVCLNFRNLAHFRGTGVLCQMVVVTGLVLAVLDSLHMDSLREKHFHSRMVEEVLFVSHTEHKDHALDSSSQEEQPQDHATPVETQATLRGTVLVSADQRPGSIFVVYLQR